MILACLYSCLESQLITSPPKALQISIESFVFPTAVVPTMKIVKGLYIKFLTRIKLLILIPLH